MSMKYMFRAAFLIASFIVSMESQAEFGELVILNETTEAGITEIRFDLEVNGVTVPGVIWVPEGAQGPRPVVLFGHGGSQNKKADNIVRMARDLVTTEYYAAVAIDGPGHGDRVTPEAAAALRSDTEARRAAVRAIDTTAEWQAVLTRVQELEYIGDGPVGYWGVSMGTRNGVPFVGNDERVDAAILGLFGLFPEGTVVKEGFEAAARNIDIPLMFVFQWDDTLMTREDGMELFDVFGSSEKVMHVNPGGHVGIPVSERETWKPFFVSNLGKAKIVSK